MAGALLEPEPGTADEKIDHQLIGRLSIAYMMTMIGAVMQIRGGDHMDLLIVVAIYHGNGEKKRGVSRNAVSRMLNVPLETIRRRVNALVERKTLAEQDDGLVFAYGDDFTSETRSPLGELNLQALRKLFQALKTHGIKLD